MKRCKSRVNSSFETKLITNHCLDIERCQEELLKARKKYNKLNQSYLELKVEYNKLEKDYRYNIKLMQSIINESNISAISEFLEENNNINNNENNNNSNKDEIIKQSNLSKSTLKILKEKSIYEKLKLEIMNLRDELKEKENIIDDLKSNTKASKFKELDYKYAQTYQELNQVKSRNEILEKMQSDYINSKNQIIFLLQQIDLYKKDNKKQKEQLEKLIFTHQNTIQQKEQNDNIKNIDERKIKVLKYENEKLKKKLNELQLKNLSYLDELERYRNLKQNQIDKSVLKKDNEIRRYKSQIAELKIEMSKLQKKLEEKNKITINSANNTVSNKKNSNNFKLNKKEINKDMGYTDSNFFVTNQKISLGDDKNIKISNEKIVINSKDIQKNTNNNKDINNNNINSNNINNNNLKMKQKIKMI